MLKLFKWIYNLGYQHARAHYLHRFTDRGRRRDWLELELFARNEDQEEWDAYKRERLQKDLDFESALAGIVREVFNDTRQNNQP